MVVDIFHNWFAGYTIEVRNQISDYYNVSSDLTEWGWPVKDTSAVIDEVDLKITHTYQVIDNCVEIAKWLELPDRDIKLAKIIGMFHDLGRFRQALNYGTMDDRITGLHGEMSADIFLNDAPKDGLTSDDIEIIAASLRYHNLFKLPCGLSQRATLFCKLVRDGDKLDIFRFYIDCIKNTEKRNFRFIMSDGEGDYSPEMLEGVLNGKNLMVGGINNKNDRKLVQISLVYDMNFGYTFQKMLEKEYLAMFTGINNGTADNVMQKAYTYATEWMKERVNG
ncbi:MAG: HD domain-containing protein [Defluviitaleaceae bacterium]|nr:HD domain-containing protein [Defluviitaleaceae bacterium]